MMNFELPRYMIAMAPGEDFEPVVIQTEYPFAVGHAVLVGKDMTEKVEYWNNESANGRAAKCLGHTVYMTIAGSLDDYEIEPEEKETILREMAEYFTETRLKRSPSMYKVNCENPKEIPSKEVRDYYQAKRQAYLRHRKEREGR